MSEDETALEQILAEFQDLKKRIGALDSNGKLAAIQKEMKKVASNSQIVVKTVKAHGNVLANVERVVTELNMRCPMLRADGTCLGADDMSNEDTDPDKKL